MAKQAMKSKAEIATIDCELVTIETADGREFGFDTANKIEVEPQIDEQDAVTLVVKGILRAQKPKKSTITGNEITLSDNVFNPELVMILQGGEIVYDPQDPKRIVGYNPPVAGSKDKGETFKLNAYSAQYDASGQIVQFEKISYPNCQGVPVAFGSEDGAFRAPEYTITSAPKTGEHPYTITYVTALPELVEKYELAALTFELVNGTADANAKLVAPKKEDYTDKFVYRVYTADPAAAMPEYGTVPEGYADYDPEQEIVCAVGEYVALVETDSKGKAIAGGSAQRSAATGSP